MASRGSIKPISLNVNCGFARVAIRELTPCDRKCLNHEERASKFQSLYTGYQYAIPDDYFTCKYGKKHHSQFNRDCEKILKGFANKWHPHNTKKEYTEKFSISTWHALSAAENQVTLFLTVLRALHNSMSNKSTSHSNQFSSHHQC